jgi:cation diffusion facilitator CzcD-associated flavoprotein CzcO
MHNVSEVAIVGAGPYGLSIAAHLRAREVSFRIFGTPMQVWREHMPRGMLLKSDGFASNLSAPLSAFTLKQFCLEQSIAYDDKLVPVQLKTFVRYGLEFQKRIVPELEDRCVVDISRDSKGFAIRLADGETAWARKVVLAVGISHFAFTPEILTGLSSEFVSHSSTSSHPESFRGRHVAVVGAGSSAIDWAALLHEAGAEVTVIARAPAIRFHEPPVEHRSWWNQACHPGSGIGPGWRSRLYTCAPHWFHALPQGVRTGIVSRHLGPAAGWTMKKRVCGHVPLWTGQTIHRADIQQGRLLLTLTDQNRATTDYRTDHVIAATGYRVDLRRLQFLSEDIRSSIGAVEHTPILSGHFQSSVPGLYFVGAAAANSFGPMMRFAFGAAFTARRISRHLGGTPHATFHTLTAGRSVPGL